MVGLGSQQLRRAGHTVTLFDTAPDLARKVAAECGCTAAASHEDLAGSEFLITMLPTGQIVRLGYAGRNGAPYVPLGRLLVQAGELAPDAVSMQQVRAWLAAHSDRAQALMEQNPNYVFFRLLDGLRPR